ncbi:unnamed protein product, partial [Mesorhabditis spiculigera]
MDSDDLELDASCACRRRRHTKSYAALTTIFDLAFLTAAFLKCIHFFKLQRYNSFSTAAVTAGGCLYSVHIICILLAWAGLAAGKSLFLVPKIVLKTITVLMCLAATALLAFFIQNDFSVVGRLIAENTPLDYYEQRTTMEMAAMIIVGIGTVATIIQFWLLVLLVQCYRGMTRREIREAVLRQKRRRAYSGKGQLAPETPKRHLPRLESSGQLAAPYETIRPDESNLAHQAEFVNPGVALNHSTGCLAKEEVTLDQIGAIVVTHAHPGVMGNLNFFGQKPILFHSLEFIGRHVTPTELKDRPYRKVSQNVEVWKTPGHTQHDLTVLVHNVAGYGTMAVTGDLIPNEQLIAEKRDIMSEEGVWDSAIKRQNANLIICMADWIVPGHGTPFRVLPHYRQKAGCTRLLQQRYSLNQFA